MLFNLGVNQRPCGGGRARLRASRPSQFAPPFEICARACKQLHRVLHPPRLARGIMQIKPTHRNYTPRSYLSDGQNTNIPGESTALSLLVFRITWSETKAGSHVRTLWGSIDRVFLQINWNSWHFTHERVRESERYGTSTVLGQYKPVLWRGGTLYSISREDVSLVSNLCSGTPKGADQGPVAHGPTRRLQVWPAANSITKLYNCRRSDLGKGTRLEKNITVSSVTQSPSQAAYAKGSVSA